MKKKLKHIDEFLDQDAMFEMANIGEKTTGLPMVIWVSPKMSSHGPRIKVSKTYDKNFNPNYTFSVSISNSPEIVAGDQGKITNEDVKRIFNWILLNKELLLKFWDNKILTDDLIELIKKI